QDEVVGLAVSAGVRGAVIGLVPIGVWLLLGERRRAELARPSLSRAVVVTASLGLVTVAVVQPWRGDAEHVDSPRWLPLRQAVPELQVPDQLGDVEVQGGLLTRTTRKFISSGFDSFRRSTEFFQQIEAKAPLVGPQL